MIYLQKIKTIPSHTEYGCDQHGNVYDIIGSVPFMLKTFSMGGDPKGGRYRGVYIRKTGTKSGMKYVHRLVAETWLAGWKPGLHVDHINRVRTDNVPQNLRCLTREENLQNSASLGVSLSPAKGKTKNRFCFSITTSLGIKKRAYVIEEKSWQKRVDLVDQHYKYNWINDALKDIRSDGIWMFIHKLTTYQYNLDPKYVDRLLAGVSIYDPPRKKIKKI